MYKCPNHHRYPLSIPRKELIKWKTRTKTNPCWETIIAVYEGQDIKWVKLHEGSIYKRHIGSVKSNRSTSIIQLVCCCKISTAVSYSQF